MGKKGKRANRNGNQASPNTNVAPSSVPPSNAPNPNVTTAQPQPTTTPRKSTIADRVDAVLASSTIVALLINLFSNVISAWSFLIVVVCFAWIAWRKAELLHGWKRIVVFCLIPFVSLSALAIRTVFFNQTGQANRFPLRNSETQFAAQTSHSNFSSIESHLQSAVTRKQSITEITPLLQAFKQNNDLTGLESFLISQQEEQPGNDLIQKELAAVEVCLGKFTHSLQRLKRVLERAPGDKEASSLISVVNIFLEKTHTGLILSTKGQNRLDERSRIYHLLVQARWHGMREERIEQLDILRTAQTLVNSEQKVDKLKVQSDLVACLLSMRWYLDAKAECAKGRGMAKELANDLVAAQFDILMAFILYKEKSLEEGNRLLDTALKTIGDLILLEGPVIMLSVNAKNTEIHGYLAASTLANFYYQRAIHASTNERIALLQRAASLYQISNQPVLAADCQNLAGSTAKNLGLPKDGILLHQQALSNYLLTGLSNRQVAVMIQLAQLHAITGNRDKAIEFVRSAESISRLSELSSNDPSFLRDCTDVLTLARRFGEASLVYDKLLRNSGNLSNVDRVIVTNNALICAIRGNDKLRATGLLNELSRLENIELSEYIKAQVFHTKACYEARWGNPEYGDQLNNKALEVFSRLNDRESQGVCYLVLSEIRSKQGNFVDAQKWVSVAKSFLSERMNLTVNEEIESLELSIAQGIRKNKLGTSSVKKD